MDKRLRWPVRRPELDDQYTVRLRGTVMPGADQLRGSRERDKLTELKHRPRGETRLVPLHPGLVALLLQHLKKYPPDPTGRIFTGPRAGIFNDRAYLKVFHKARAIAFTGSEATPLLARRPYDLRHAAVSPGSTPEYQRRRSPSGRATAWTSCCASTPSASPGSKPKPSAGSR
jgi:integrase